MENAFVLNRSTLRQQLAQKWKLNVTAAPVGRAAIYIPALDDGLGPLYTPNAKDIHIKLSGSDGWVELQKLEAGPQVVKVDGSQVVVINRVDEFTRHAIRHAYDVLLARHGGDFNRSCITQLLDYVRGYSYNHARNEVQFNRNSGFHGDIWPVPEAEFRQTYVNHDKPDVRLSFNHFSHNRFGYYSKIPQHYGLAFIAGSFTCPFVGVDGHQQFNDGAFVAIPQDTRLPPRLIDLTDMDLSYQHKGHSVLPKFGEKPVYPIYRASDLAAR
jgi:hypothetical protein